MNRNVSVLGSQLLFSRWTGLQLMSFAVLLCLFAVALPSASLAQLVNPVPSGELCPNGSPRIVWNYAPEAGLPANASPFNCPGGQNCFIVPLNACLEVVEKKEVLSSHERVPTLPPSDKPADLPGGGLVTPWPDLNALLPKLRPTMFGMPTGHIAAPDGECSTGHGWDFERFVDINGNDAVALPGLASLDGWEGEGSPFTDFQNHDLDLRAAPVYGNAIPIANIRPPGWRPDIEPSLGGDYWKYSQDINYSGSFWLSSLYRRYSWGQNPGATGGENETGRLTSPPCILQARYLTFRMSGGMSSSQRVEVQAANSDPKLYYGVYFPGSLGDPSRRGRMGTATQIFSEAATLPPQLYPPDVAGDWVTVRSATSVAPAETEWMQIYVFDLKEFVGEKIRIRVVDDGRDDCLARYVNPCFKHINADAFRFADKEPMSMTWFGIIERACRKNRETDPENCGPVGFVPSEPPVWGVTDAHAHPMANLGFGGHVFWGDVTDNLNAVYDCASSLPEIPGPGGRKAISEAAVTSKCYVTGQMSFIISGAALAGCATLNVVPFVGTVAAAVCAVGVGIAEVELLTRPVMTGLTLHGGKKFSNGAFQLGGMLKDSWQLYLRALALAADPKEFAAGLIPGTDGFPKVEGSSVWYMSEDNWHSLTGLGKTHNQYQKDMLKRAFDGGLRLGVWDVVNSRAFGFVSDGDPFASDWRALKDQTDAAKRIVAHPEVSRFAQIAYSPAEAVTIIRSGKMAVVLGTEVDELGRMRPQGLAWPRSPRAASDSMQEQVNDLWELGIRKISPVHAVNNPIGGAGLFVEPYVANNHYLNGSPLDGEPTFIDGPVVKFVLDWLFAGVPINIVLGDFSIIKDVGGDAKVPWNPEGWFEFMQPLTGPEKPVGSHAEITWRVNAAGRANGEWLPPSQSLEKSILKAQALNNFQLFIKAEGRCDLNNTTKPDYFTSFGTKVDAQFVAVAGHANRLGIFRNGGDDGEAFLRAAMKKGMIIDADHMSQKMREDFYALARTYSAEAGWAVESAWDNTANCSGKSRCGDYPVMGVHSTIRQVEKEGSDKPHLINDFGDNNETTRTLNEIGFVAANKGTIGVFPRSTFIPPNTSGNMCTRDSDCASWDGKSLGESCKNNKCKAGGPPDLNTRNFKLPAEVRNDCDGSSKSFALKFLIMADEMKGHGLTLTSDFNGMISTMNSRFGMTSSMGCGKDDRAKTLKTNPTIWSAQMREWQKIEHSGIWYEDYEIPGRGQQSAMSSGLLPDRHNYREVVARAWSETREDMIPRARQYNDSANTKIDERVYYTTFGENNVIHRWNEQTSNRPGAQMYPLKRWLNRLAGWDFNLDGFKHVGMYPDLLQDMRNVGVQWEQMGPLFHGSNDFIETWRKSVEIGYSHR